MKPCEIRRAAALALFVMLGCTCDSASSNSNSNSNNKSARRHEEPSSLVTFFTSSGDVPVRVEIADEPHELSRGLMYRESLRPNNGMLFMFPEEDDHPFWMKNTYISLDMIFLDAHTKVVGIVANAAPMSTTSLSIGKASKYVVEVNAGFAKEHAIVEGVSARFELEPRGDK